MKRIVWYLKYMNTCTKNLLKLNGSLNDTYTRVQNYVYMHKFTDFSETMTYNLMNFRGMIHNIMTHKCKRKNCRSPHMT